MTYMNLKRETEWGKSNCMCFFLFVRVYKKASDPDQKILQSQITDLLIQGFFCNFGKGPLGLSDGKISTVNPLIGKFVIVQVRHFWSIKNKLTITHTIAIKLKVTM